VAVPAFDVDVVDATGAGDAFVAGLVDAWLLAGEPAAEAGRHAAAVAALNCTATGARGGLPDRAAVEQFRRERA
jgi:ribokinase/sulfofructose kinase